MQFYSYPRTEATLSHNTRVPAVASSPCLGLEHVVVVPLVVAVPEALGAQGHALRDATGHAPVGYKVRGPHEPAHHGVVVFLNIDAEVIGGPAPAHQPLAPLDSLTIVNILVRVQ